MEEEEMEGALPPWLFTLSCNFPGKWAPRCCSGVKAYIIGVVGAALSSLQGGKLETSDEQQRKLGGTSVPPKYYMSGVYKPTLYLCQASTQPSVASYFFLWIRWKRVEWITYANVNINGNKVKQVHFQKLISSHIIRSGELVTFPCGFYIPPAIPSTIFECGT